MTAFIVIAWILIGFVAGAVVGTEIGPLFGFRNMEGSSAIFGVFFGSPIGAVLGGWLGFKLARRFGDDLRKRRLVAIGSLALVVGIPFGIWLFETARTWDQLYQYGGTFGLSFQVRLPAGTPNPAESKIGIELRSAKENPTCNVSGYPHGLTQEGEHFLVSGECQLKYATPKRTLLVRIGEAPTLVFNVRVKSRPESRTYSDWFPVDEIYNNATGQKRPPRPDEKYEIHYGAR